MEIEQTTEQIEESVEQIEESTMTDLSEEMKLLETESSEKSVKMESLEKLEIQWITIKDYPNYKISNTGIIKNFKTENEIKQQIYGGYYRVHLHDFSKDKSKYYYIHKLIGEYFIENKDNVKIVDHIDGNKLNNSISNLRWCNSSKNVQNWHSNRNNYNKVEQYDMNGELIKLWNSISSIVEELHIKYNYISRCCSGSMESYNGSIWKYENKHRKQQIKIIIDLNEYKCIGIIKQNDYSNYYISLDGKKIINIEKEKEITFFMTSTGYKIVYLYPIVSNKKSSGLLVHKIINQVLMDGKYDDIIDHINGKKDDNSIDNLEVVTLKENTTRACGKSVKQIDMKTGKIINTFRSTIEAFEYLKIKRNGHISAVCDRKQKTAYGSKWEWNN